ncbi:DUF4922 domain-containing protein [Carboxylicivirga sp. A043]|uniref:DUF4922 domain-containing protein n=1 Tax=Carboxylicivirga litoralis TaxID=2816963 RepID=UPI0021CAE395|nr:DUF4922 domain-containing protein [Carboxylicivirga sp. A043]MCU4156360.1 DUF4922 domain-containing protein [Carboxylicivirga sp. A043]
MTIEDKNYSRTLNATNGLAFNLKYIADKQNLSWYNKQEYLQKQCEYCAFTSSKKEPIHSLIRSGVSLFNDHELLVADIHAGEYIGVHLKHMLNIVDENKGAAIAFEGSKNAPIKKYHFSCHFIADKNRLPITTDLNKNYNKVIFSQNNLSISILDVYGRNPIYITSSSADVLVDTFHKVEKQIGVNYSTNSHPYINLVIWKEDNKYILAAIPRVVYKPTEFYDETNLWDIAPGVLEMSGLYLISNHSEFISVNVEQLQEIANEVSFSNSHILEIINTLDLS